MNTNPILFVRLIQAALFVQLNIRAIISKILTLTLLNPNSEAQYPNVNRNSKILCRAHRTTEVMWSIVGKAAIDFCGKNAEAHIDSPEKISGLIKESTQQTGDASHGYVVQCLIEQINPYLKWLPKLILEDPGNTELLTSSNMITPEKELILMSSVLGNNQNTQQMRDLVSFAAYVIVAEIHWGHKDDHSPNIEQLAACMQKSNEVALQHFFGDNRPSSGV